MNRSAAGTRAGSEGYEHAIARGAKIYAEIVGEGMTSDAYHMTAPDPEGKGAERVMRLALRDAGLEPEMIDFINTHGTSTPLGDVTEVKAIQRVFGEHVYDMNPGLHQVDDRPPDRRDGSRRGNRLRDGTQRRYHPAYHQP